jgi:hypothetical protein
MTRTDALNHVIKAKGYKSYLEIGVQTGENFAAIKCERKVGVDPDPGSPAVYQMTSDKYFNEMRSVDEGEQELENFDLIFIDGLHTHAQSFKDFENALNNLNKGGCIAFHDTLPHNLQYTFPNWCGDVWKTAHKLAASGFRLVTANWDHGTTFVYPNENDLPFYENGLSQYPGLVELRKALNAVDSLDELVLESDVVQEPKADLTEADLKAAYKEKFGTHYRGKFDREKILAKLSEA